MGTLTFLDDPASQDVARAMGKAGLMSGISKEIWCSSYSWMSQLGLGNSYAEGVWLEGDDAGELARVPALLIPVAQKIGLITDED